MFIVFFTHPAFFESNSMPRYALWLKEGMAARGHQTELLTPVPFFSRMFKNKFLKKWMGYVDQYILFPFYAKKKINSFPVNSLFIFTDHALGPWVPLIKNRYHVIHCHDFLAQLSALGEIKENSTSWTGRLYQIYIRNGYRHGRHFISISKKTQQDLHKMLRFVPYTSEVIYNGLRRSFPVAESSQAAKRNLQKIISGDLSNGYILHVGGNQWYKNRRGVIEIYDCWRASYGICIPLLMIGSSPSRLIVNRRDKSDFYHDIYFLTNVNDDLLCSAYSAATVLLFPSIAEGFGWPLAEAMAAGCPVITTREPPMTEVVGKAGFLIPKMPCDEEEIASWAKESAKVLETVVTLSPEQRKKVVENGRENVRRFDSDKALDKIERTYSNVILAG